MKYLWRVIVSGWFVYALVMLSSSVHEKIASNAERVGQEYGWGVFYTGATIIGCAMLMGFMAGRESKE